MSIYTRVIRPILFAFTDPEWIHNKTLHYAEKTSAYAPLRWIIKKIYFYEHKTLENSIAGISFPNPIGLAAGMDKDAQMTRFLPCIGFGFEEVGSVTAEPYEGNPGKRMLRIPKDKGIIVNYGLKNIGMRRIKKRLAQQKKYFTIPIGVSVAKTNKPYASHAEGLADWCTGITTLKDTGDYLTINLSCPNTQDTRNHSKPEHAKKLLDRLASTSFNKPVFLKLSSELTTREVEEMVALCDQAGFISGFILTNLNKNRALLTTEKDVWEKQPGGVSGATVQHKALMLVKHLYTHAGDRYVIIGCGGIFTADDAYAYIRNGASLVQLVTGLVYEGPGIAKNINKGLVKLLIRDGHAQLSEAIGSLTTKHP